MVKWVKPLNRTDFNAKTRRGSRRRAEAALWRAAKVGGAGVNDPLQLMDLCDFALNPLESREIVINRVVFPTPANGVPQFQLFAGANCSPKPATI